jgi:alpha-N-acetylglucosamine transferase
MRVPCTKLADKSNRIFSLGKRCHSATSPFSVIQIRLRFSLFARGRLVLFSLAENNIASPFSSTTPKMLITVTSGQIQSFKNTWLKNPYQTFFRFAGIAAVVLLLLSSFIYTFLYTSYPAPTITMPTEEKEPVELPAQRRAYVTFFSTRIENDTLNDPYFTAVRTLSYQILRHPETRTQLDIPFLVLVPPHVSNYKRQVLAAEGATVVPIELLLPTNNTFKPGESRWEDQFCKLRLFEMTQYDRVLYLDTDMLLTRSLDGIWDEPVAQEVQQTRTNSSMIQPDEAPLPTTYVFTGVYDAGPVATNNINGGFWLVRPDTVLFTYYRSLMNIEGRYDTTFMEQSMLNYAHRREGNMPWTPFPKRKWNTNWPSEKDLKDGCASLHDKFWSPDNAGWIDRKLVELWWRMQGNMEGYWRRKWLKTSTASIS